ncbi:glyoxalase [Vibrio sp. TH_r3]|uniref:VOC family protein n=1 Tax=Vibrio sp. TH_r3 TaxID=3082084 RepID=UPI00295421C0|nr:VOC family protein [Vibrio sp. TH_r3]MDV7103410.1 glyoxalase [Vibrio sp. TH_r3]
MITKNAVLRVARMTDNLVEISDMYKKALGFDVLSEYKDEDGFDAIVLGHKNHSYHLEFTTKPESSDKDFQVADTYMVFYMPDTREWEWVCRSMIEAGFKYVEARNPYWKRVGKTYEDIEGYRIVIQNRDWSE